MKTIEDIKYKPLSRTDSPCSGCRILDLNRQFYTWLDYEDLKESQVLFVTDSAKVDYSKDKCALLPDQLKMLKDNILFKDFAITPSIKCPNIKETDLKPADMAICRKHLSDTIDKVKPKLIIALGNLALKMLTKKSGVSDKRGTSFPYESLTGFKSTIVPTYHPYAVMLEPRHLTLFRQDIRIAYDKIIVGDTKKVNENHKLITSLEQLRDYEWLWTTGKNVAIDTETTGLDFKKDKVLTIAFAWSGGYAICLPVHHKESFAICEQDKQTIINFIKKVLNNPNNNKKIFHKASFDIKMMYKDIGFIPTGVRDTKILAHHVDEISPNGLADLVKKYYPEALVTL